MPTPMVGNGFGNSLEAIVATLDDVHTLQHELGVILKQEARNSPTQQPLASPRDYDKTDTDSENDSDGAAQDPDRTFVVDSPERWLRAAAQHANGGSRTGSPAVSLRGSAPLSRRGTATSHTYQRRYDSDPRS